MDAEHTISSAPLNKTQQKETFGTTTLAYNFYNLLTNYDFKCSLFHVQINYQVFYLQCSILNYTLTLHNLSTC